MRQVHRVQRGDTLAETMKQALHNKLNYMLRKRSTHVIHIYIYIYIITEQYEEGLPNKLPPYDPPKTITGEYRTYKTFFICKMISV